MISSQEIPSSSPDITIQEPANNPSNPATINKGFPYGMEDLVRKAAAEAIGCFVMVFSVSGILATGELLTGGIQVELMAYAMTAAFTVILLITALSSISGAHVNPAITIAFAAVGPFPWSQVPLYVLAQLVGSLLATYAGILVYGIKSEVLMTKPLNGNMAAFMVEFIAAMIIVFVISSLSDDTQPNSKFSAFVTGVAVGLGVLITGSVSGGSLNPARSLGPALVSRDLEEQWIYLLAPTFGSISGGLFYRILRLQGWSVLPPSQIN